MCRCLVFFLLALLPVVSFAGTELAVSFPGYSDATPELKVDRHGIGQIQLLLESGQDSSTLQFKVSKFRGNSGLINVKAREPGLGKDPQTEFEIAAGPKRRLVTLELEAENLPVDGNYTGVLLIREKIEDEGNGSNFKSNKLVLSREAPRWVNPDDEANPSIQTLAVDTSGRFSLHLLAGESGFVANSTTERVKLSLSAFTVVEDGHRASVDILTGVAGNETANTSAYVDLKPGSNELVLDAGKLEFGKTYSGILSVSIEMDELGESRDSTPNPVVYPALTLKLTRIADEASLVAKILPVATDNPCKAIIKCKPPAFDINLHEENKQFPLRELKASWAPGAYTATARSFDTAKTRLMLISENVAPVEIWSGADRSTSIPFDIPPNTSANLRVEFLNKLGVGEYQVPLEIWGANTKSKDSRVIVKVSVLRPPWFLAAVLLFGIAISWAFTKYRENDRKGRALMQRIGDLEKRPGLDRDCCNLMPVMQAVVLVARLREGMERERGRSFLLSAAVIAAVEASLVEIEKRIDDLDRLVRLWQEWTSSNEPLMVAHRAQRELRQIAELMAQAPEEKPFGVKVTNGLAQIEEWQNPEKCYDNYWPRVVQTSRKLLSEIVLDDYSAEDEEELFGLLQNLESGIGDLTKLDDSMEKFDDLIRRSHDAQLNKAASNLLEAWSKYGQNEVTELEASCKHMLGGLTTFKQGKTHTFFVAAGQVRLQLKKKIWIELEAICKSVSEGGVTLTNTIDQKELVRLVSNIRKAIEVLNLAKGTVTYAETVASSDLEIMRYLIESLQSKLDSPPSNQSDAVKLDLAYYAPLKLIHKQPSLEKEGRQRKSILIDSYRKKIDLLQPPENALKWGEIDFKIRPKIPNDGQGDGENEYEYLADSHAFKYKFAYHWFVEYEYKPQRPHLLLHPVKYFFSFLKNRDKTPRKDCVFSLTSGPRATIFIPVKGAKINAAVTVYRDRHEADAHTTEERCSNARATDGDRQLIDSIEFKQKTVASDYITRFRGMRRGELIYFFAAVFAAFYVGITTQQFSAAEKGSWLAVFILFAWGIVADQVKNKFQAFSSNI